MSTMGWRGVLKGDEGWYSAIHRLLGPRRGLCSLSPLHERGTSRNREPILDQEGTQENGFRNRQFTLVIRCNKCGNAQWNAWIMVMSPISTRPPDRWPMVTPQVGHLWAFSLILVSLVLRPYDIWYSPYSCNPCLNNYLNFELMLTHHFSPLRWPCIRGKKSTV